VGRLDPATFDVQTYLDQFHFELLATSEGRRELTKLRPLLFALLYFPHHLRDAGIITFAEAHFEWCRLAREWAIPTTQPRAWRHAFAAPRSTGKTSWFYLILIAWAAAHRYIRFVAAFSDSAGQAETHLQTFRHELDTNDLLRHDWPELVAPRKKSTGGAESDSRSMFIARSGFVFAAKGVDAASLGLKVNERRPDLLLLDDVEPDESSYSGYQAEKRLTTIMDAVLPLSEHARVVWTGTVTMPNSLMHQLVRAAQGEQPEQWIADEHITAHHHEPILVNDDGTERSIWPGKWPLQYLKSIQHTRSYAKNFDNSPLGRDGGYWTPDDIRVGVPTAVTRKLLSIDPSGTDKRTSDPAGLAVVGYSPTEQRCAVYRAFEVRQVGEQLRQTVLRVLADDPLIRLVLVESNVAGDHWPSILHHLPDSVKLKTVYSTAPKEVRAADLLNDYQRRRVLHAESIPRLVEQMVSFPRAPHDDLVDAVGAGVAFFLHPIKPTKATATVASYV
jgi:hypothetical protein